MTLCSSRFQWQPDGGSRPGAAAARGCHPPRAPGRIRVRDDEPVTTRTLLLDPAHPDASPVPATVSAPVGGPGPRGGVILVQDARGITPYLRSVLERLADEGWLAVAPHLYHRDGIDEVDPADGWAAAMPQMARLTGAGIADDTDAALAHLGAAGLLPGRSAILGFCMGGTVALATGVRHALGAAVTFYGGGVSAAAWDGVAPLVELAPSLASPWLGLYGEDDELITRDEIAALRDAAAGSAVPNELVSYPGAGHAFHSDDRAAVYRQDAATDAWQRAIAWLDRYLPPA
jgi:carboxymethylenebutenolidase